MSVSLTGAMLAVILIATAGWSLASLPPLHPAQLWALPWSLAAALYAIRLLPYRPLSWTTTALAAAATVAFVLCSCAGCALARRLRKTSKQWPSAEYSALRMAAAAAVALTIIGATAFVARAAVSYGLGDTLTASSRVRVAISRGALALEIKYVYFAIAGVAVCSIAAGLAPKRRMRLTWLVTAAACGASIYLATGRATLITALVVGMTAFLLSREPALDRRRFLFGIAAVAAAALGLFIAGGELIGKTYANSVDLQGVPSVFARHRSVSTFALPYQYATAPVAALDVQVQASNALGGAEGCAEVTEVCKVLRRLGWDVSPVPRVRPFTAPPLPWNTFTALDLPLIDGGKALAVPIVAVIGLLCGALWSWSRHGSSSGIAVYAIEAAAIAGSPAVFLFTAPHLAGAIAIALLLITLAGFPQKMRRPSQEGETPPRPVA